MEGPFDAFDERCPSRAIMDDVVDRWPALVLVALAESPLRFAETARAVGGISDRMLSRTLATLASDGLIARTERTERHVDYELTDSGRRIAAALQQLVSAVYEVMPQVLAARRAGEPGAD